MANVTEIHDDMIDITEPRLNDDSISEIHYHDYTPQTQANNNSLGHHIKIDINAQDIFTLPSTSYISITGQIRRADNNAAYEPANEITLINNAMMYLFSSIKYDLGPTTIEHINHPGQVTSMLGYLTYPDDFSTSAGLTCCWAKDTTIAANSYEFERSAEVANVVAGAAVPAIPVGHFTPIKNPNYNRGFATRKAYLFKTNPRGCFTFHIPLDHIFGFAAEYKKLIYGVKHTLTLTRAADTEALHRNGTTNGKVDITDISWNMQQVKMAPEYLTGLMSVIEQKTPLDLSFQARTCEQTTLSQTLKQTWRLSVTGGVEKPRWIIIGLQTAKSNTQEQNPAVFDNLDLNNAHITLNSERYPMRQLNVNFARNDYIKLYNMFDAFKKDNLGISNLVGGTQANVEAFSTLFPILVFDVRRQSEKLKTGVQDIQVRFEFGTIVPAETMAYAVMLSDRFFKLSSDGKNMSVMSM